MKKRIIVTAAITACLALCATVSTLDRKGRENTHTERNDRRNRSTADASGSRETGAASGNRKERKRKCRKLNQPRKQPLRSYPSLHRK